MVQKLQQRWVKRESLSALPDALYTSEQVRELDRRAIAGGTAGIVLMRRAAAAVFAEINQRWPDIKKLLVFCGKGNNGGDGYLIARLALARGLSIDVVELGGCDNAGDAATARNTLLDDGLVPQQWGPATAGQLDKPDLIVDALLGTGIKGEVRPDYVEAIDCINKAGCPVIAVDIPSGVCSDSGAIKGRAVIADATVSFIGLKRGQLTGEAVDCVGELCYASLNVEHNIFNDLQPAAKLINIEELMQSYCPRRASAYKQQSGHVLIIGGDYGMAGAALLAASAALRCGAGLVSVATRPEHVSAFVGRQPEIMVRGIEKTADLDAMLASASAVVIGPGLGQGAWSQQLLRQCRDIAVPLVFDADALNLLARNPQWLPVADAVMTPHPGEAKRLLQQVAKEISENISTGDRFALAQSLHNHYQKTLVLKGAGTLVEGRHQTSVCAYGNALLATAGSGDVLSGVIGTLLAQGYPSDYAAELGVCLHALAAEQWAEENGVIGMGASDLPQYIARVLSRLLAE